MNVRPFEIALIGIFVVAGLVGLVMLANWKNDTKKAEMIYGESVVIWGTFDAGTIDRFIAERASQDSALKVVRYIEKDERHFEEELINAIADGKSPDLIIIPHTQLVSLRTKLQPVGPDARTYRDMYIDGAEIFMLSDGVYGVPFGVDPLVMYWNRDLFSSSGLALPPKTWEALVSQTAKAVTRMDDELNITQSAVAFGEYTNVTHAKDVLAMLFLQAGSEIVREDINGYTVNLNQSTDAGLTPGDAVLTFYTQFSNPKRDLYSWNRSLDSDRKMFVEGKLSLYFGKGSEKDNLERENSNLNFDIATVPQGSGSTVERNYGDFYAFAVPRASKNITGAVAVAAYFGSPTSAKQLSDAFHFAPVHRALFNGSETDPFKKVIESSALTARGWLDPDSRGSDDVFRKMVEEASLGRMRLKNVIMDAVRGLEDLF